MISEDDVNESVAGYLKSDGWNIESQSLGHKRGCDIVAKKGTRSLYIEAKGESIDKSAGNRNNFLEALGQLLMRMEDGAEYALALPDNKQYKNYWEKLPACAKTTMKLSAYFVSVDQERNFEVKMYQQK